MSEARVYADGYSAVFAQQEEFLQFLKNIGKSSSWVRNKVRNLRFVALTEQSAQGHTCVRDIGSGTK